MQKMSVGATLCGTLVLCFLASHAAFAEPLLDGRFNLNPQPDGRSVFAVQGWAVAQCDEPGTHPVEVVLFIDDVEIRRGSPFLAWPGVEELHPDVPGAELAGFSGQVDPARLGLGEHSLEVMVEACGLKRSLGTRSFRVEPPTSSWVAVPILLALLAAVGLLGTGLVRLRPLREAMRGLPGVVVAISAGVVAVVVAAQHLAAPVREIDGGLFAPLANWDGNYYLDLATGGYGSGTDPSIAFLPLFPMVLRMLSFLPGPLELFGALFNLAAFAAAVVLLRKLYPDRDHAVLFFAVFPFAFFHMVVYTEALTLLLAVAFVTAVRGRRLPWVALLGFLAALCRIPAIALVCFAIGPLLRKDWRAASVIVAAPVCGMVGWMTWLGFSRGDPFVFLHAQSEFGRSTAFHPGVFLDYLASLSSRGGMVWWELGALFAVLAGAAALTRLRRFDEALYCASVVLIPLFSMRLACLNRYALAAFPVFILVGSRLAGSMPRMVFRLVIAAELVGLVYFAARFGLQYWVG